MEAVKFKYQTSTTNTELQTRSTTPQLPRPASSDFSEGAAQPLPVTGRLFSWLSLDSYRGVHTALKDAGVEEERIEALSILLQKIELEKEINGQQLINEDRGAMFIRRQAIEGLVEPIICAWDGDRAEFCVRGRFIGSALEDGRKVYLGATASGYLVRLEFSPSDASPVDNKRTYAAEAAALNLFQGVPYIAQGQGLSDVQLLGSGERKDVLVTGIVSQPVFANREFFSALSPVQRWGFFLKTLLGVKAIHARHLIHGNLRAETILVANRQGKIDPEITCLGGNRPIGWRGYTTETVGPLEPPEISLLASDVTLDEEGSLSWVKKFKEELPGLAPSFDIWILGYWAAEHLGGLKLPSARVGEAALYLDVQQYCDPTLLSATCGEEGAALILSMLEPNPWERASLDRCIEIAQVLAGSE